MNQRDENWEQEDDQVVRRLRDEKPEASALELDRMKTAAMAKAKPARSIGGRSRSRIAAALLTVGLMAAGTAGTVAATNGSTSGSGAAQSEYKPCDHGGPKDRARCLKEHCAKGTTHDRERCLCDKGGPADRARCRKELDGGTPVVVPSQHPRAVRAVVHTGQRR